MAKKPTAKKQDTKWDAKRSQGSEPTYTPCLEVTVDNVLRHLAMLAFRDDRNIRKSDGSLKPLQELDEVTAKALVGVEAGPMGVLKYRLTNREAALKMLAEYLVMFNRDGSDVKALDELLQEYRKRYVALTGDQRALRPGAKRG